jgi:hypothetical protein
MGNVTCSVGLLRARTGFLLGLLGLASPGCRGQDLSYDCETQAARFQQRVEEEEQPLRPIPETGPYQVGMQISEDGLNRLLAGVIDEGVPFGGNVPFGILPQGPANASFEAETAPTIEIASVRGCPHCILFNLEFGVQLDTDSETLSSGYGWAKLAVPLFLEGDEASGKTTLVADYGQVKIDEWYLSVFGFDSETHASLAGALRILMEESIAEEFGREELLELGSWTIGKDRVRLLAREFFLDHTHKKLAIGMATNLGMPHIRGLDFSGPLPDGIPMQILMHTDLFLGMSHQMFAEGEIPRRYDQDGNPREYGSYGVTLEEMETREIGLSTEFRVWRIAEGYCGWATVQMPHTVEVDDAMKGLVITPGAAQLVEDPKKSEGSGRAALEERELFDENRHLIDVFRDSLTDKLDATLDYSEIGLAESDIIFTTVGVDTDFARQAVVTHLDFFVVAKE